MSENRIIQELLSLVKCSIDNDGSLPTEIIETDWEQIYTITKKNLLAPLLYNLVKQLSEKYKISEELLFEWKKTAIICMLAESEKYRALNQILITAAKENLTFIVFKGCILADLYPDYRTRMSCDADILVYEKDKEKAIRIFEALGYQKDEISSKEKVCVYINNQRHHKVELHFALWEDYTGSKINLIKKMRLDREESLIRIKACNMEVTTLGYQEHFIFQIFHIIKHFSLQGVGIRYLVDITLYFNKYKKYMCIEELWEKMEQLEYDVFCMNIFSICIKYLGMSPVIMNNRKLDDIEDGLLYDLIKIGAIFKADKAGWQLLGTITPYFNGEQKIPRTKFLRKIKILFPSSRDLSKDFLYAQKCRILLPIAWIHRYISYIIKRHKNKSSYLGFREILQVAEHRLSLMQKLGLDGGRE